MKICLVDFENVNDKGLEGVQQMEAGDIVCIFYSEKADKMSFETHRALIHSAAEIRYFKTNVGEKNALDLQLASYAGYLIAQYPDSEFYIVSNDNGFSFIRKFWESVHMEQVPSLMLEPSDEYQKELIRRISSRISDKEAVRRIEESLPLCSGKADLHNVLVREFGQELGQMWYRRIRPVLLDMK